MKTELADLNRLQWSVRQMGKLEKALAEAHDLARNLQDMAAASSTLSKLLADVSVKLRELNEQLRLARNHAQDATAHTVLAARDDDQLLTQIANRAHSLATVGSATARARLLRPRVVDLALSLSKAHKGCCPLKLDELLEASDADLVHDVYGIHKHLDHDTLKFDVPFAPRFAR